MTARKTTTPANSDAVEVRGGRKPPAKTEVFDWVPLSGVSPHAICLYNLLRMHVNRERDDEEVWTSRLTLAVMMGLSRADKIDPYLAELIKIGAVEKTWAGMPRRNRYTVHSLPPPGYAGILSLTVWYQVHKPLLELKRQQEKATRDARRQKAKEQVSAVTPKTGRQAVTPKTGQQVTPKTGRQVTPEIGLHVAPFSGREPSSEFEPALTEPPPSSAVSSDPPEWAVAPEPEQQQENPSADEERTPLDALSEQERELHTECVTLRGRWSATVLAEVLADPAIRERPWPLVQRAFLIGARAAKTFTPKRLLSDACPHWDQAEKQLAAEAAEVEQAAAAAAGDVGGSPAANVVPEQRAGNDLFAVAAPDSPARQEARRVAAAAARKPAGARS